MSSISEEPEKEMQETVNQQQQEEEKFNSQLRTSVQNLQEQSLSSVKENWNLKRKVINEILKDYYEFSCSAVFLSNSIKEYLKDFQSNKGGFRGNFLAEIKKFIKKFFNNQESDQKVFLVLILIKVLLIFLTLTKKTSILLIIFLKILKIKNQAKIKI